MKLVDRITSETFSIELPIWQSPNGNVLDLHFEPTFNTGVIAKRSNGLWRYREALPIAQDMHIVSIDEGFTPLLKIDFGGKIVGIKQEQLFSSGSYKDRGATVLMSHIKSLGINNVVQDSSGNAGCAVAAYAAFAGIGCTIFLQEDTSRTKIAQMEAYGAKIKFIMGSREDVAGATLIAAQQTYYASHSWNPFFFHGTKTFAYEVCEQLGWKAPDSVVLPAGNGTLIIGCYIGFTDLLKASLIDKMPKIIAVQSINCSPLAVAFAQNKTMYNEVITQPTLAEGIAIAKPLRGNQMMEYVRKSKGHFIVVTEAEIKSAWLECAQKGFYIEPTSAATIAGLKKYMEGYPNEQIISLFSGHGLKSTDKILKMLAN